jgi:hypothetical protein
VEAEKTQEAGKFWDSLPQAVARRFSAPCRKLLFSSQPGSMLAINEIVRYNCVELSEQISNVLATVPALDTVDSWWEDFVREGKDPTSHSPGTRAEDLDETLER